MKEDKTYCHLRNHVAAAVMDVWKQSLIAVTMIMEIQSKRES